MKRTLGYKTASVPDVRTKDFAFQPAMADLADGQFAGYCAAFSNVDRAGEVILPGAFANTLPAFLKDGLICWQHDWTQPIGKPVEAKEDDHGLFIKGRIVDTPAGQTALTLMREGIVTKMSIGYQVKGYRVLSENEGRVLLGDVGYERAIKDIPPWNEGIVALTDLELFEASPVSVPANPAAAIVAVKALAGIAAIAEKGASGKTDFPLGPRDAAFDRAQAEKDIRAWAGAEDAPNAKYRQCYFWYDASAPDNFTSYKLPFCMDVGGTLKAMPRGVFRAAGAVQGARGGLDIPDGDVAGVKAKIESYYRRMAKEFDDDSIRAPWADDGKGVRLVEHSEVVRDVIEEWVGRIKGIAGLRAKEGRVLNQANRRMLTDMRDSLMQHCDSIGALLDATDPNKAAADAKEVEAELTRFLAYESRRAGVPL